MFTCKPIFCSTVRFLVSILIFAAVAVSGPPAHAQVAFSPSMNLSSNYAGGSYNPQIAVDSGGNINVVWVEDNTAQPDNGVYFSRSTDGGLTFSAPMNLPLNPGGYSFSGVRLALDYSGNIYVVCRLIGASNQPGQIMFTHSTDGGASFSPRLVVSGIGSQDSPQIGIDSAYNINIVWSENGNTNASHVEFARSTDGGNTFSWGKQIAPEDGTGGPKSPYLLVDSNGAINVMWVGFNIYFSPSSDGGATFSTKQLSSGSVSYNCCSTGLEEPMAPGHQRQHLCSLVSRFARHYRHHPLDRWRGYFLLSAAGFF